VKEKVPRSDRGARVPQLNREASRMQSRKYWAFLALGAASLLNRASLAAETPHAEECPGASAWTLGHPTGSELPPSQGDGRSAILEPALLEDLKLRVERDQAARKRWLVDQGNSELASAVDSVDTENVAWLRNLVSTRGFPTAAQVGKKGVHLAWVLLQHADQDPKLQSDLLPTLERRFSAGELPANDLARITDRVLMAGGKPQKYGTQFDWFAGDFSLPERRTLVEIDAARTKLGLMPLADYVCTLRKARSAVK
jgi:hypothetical protein